MLGKTNIFIVILGILGALTISGCISNDENRSVNYGSNNSSYSMLTDVINIQNSTFSPSNITVNVGTDVKWLNHDKITHRVISDNETFQSANLAQANIYSFTFTKEGTYNYHCAIHPAEKGIIIVKK